MTALSVSFVGPRGPIDLEFDRADMLALIGDIANLAPGLSGLLAGPAPKGAALTLDGIASTPSSRTGRQTIRRHLALLRSVAEAPFNPRWTILRVLEEPLKALSPNLSRQARRERIAAVLAEFSLDEAILSAAPGTLTPGEAQSIALVRALVAEPSLIAAINPFAGLEVEDQARLANQLLKLKTTGATAILLIQPDLAMAAHLADRIAVISDGKVVDEGTAQEIRLIPRTRYSRMIAAATRPF